MNFWSGVINGRKGRYLLLVFDCMLVVGIYFCTDIPSALQAQIEGQPTTNCSQSVNVSCCDDCLSMGAARYNLLYTISSWTSSALILPVGFIIDRMGNRLSALVFTGIATSGSFVFAIASLDSIRGTIYMFPLMMCGRLLLGAGTGSSRIVRDRVIASWFPDKLALAFGIAVSTMGIGSVLTFILTSNMPQWIGLCQTLFVGAGICSSCFLSAICLCCLDWYGTKYHPNAVVALREKTPFKCSSIKKLPASFIAMCIMVASYYGFQLPFTANGSKFLQDRYDYAQTDSSYVNGVIYDVSVVLSPFVGIILDKVGHRGWIAFLGALSTIPVGPLLLFTDMPPLVGFIWIGVSFTVTIVSLWSSIPHIVPHRLVGSANGIASCLLDLTVGLTSLAIGQVMIYSSSGTMGVVNLDGWKYVFLVLFGHATVCAIAGLILNLTCGRTERKINGKSSFRKWKRSNKWRTSSILGPVHCDNGSSSSSEEDPTDTKQTVSTLSRNGTSIIIENSALVDWLKYHHKNMSDFENGDANISKHLVVDIGHSSGVSVPAIVIVVPEEGVIKTELPSQIDLGNDNKSFVDVDHKDINVHNGLELNFMESNNG